MAEAAKYVGSIPAVLVHAGRADGDLDQVVTECWHAMRSDFGVELDAALWPGGRPTWTHLADHEKALLNHSAVTAAAIDRELAHQRSRIEGRHS